MRGTCAIPPEKGDERIITKFLWFPVCIEYKWRWLEVATIRQKFEGWNYANEDAYEHQLWENIEFINK